MNVLIGAGAGLLAGPLVLLGIRRWSRRPIRQQAAWPVAVVVACAVAGGWATGWASGPQVPAAWWILLVTGIALAVVDEREHRLPDPLLAAAGVGVLLALTLAAATGRGCGVWWQAIAASVCAFVVMYALAMFTGLGYVDVKLAAVIAGCAGFGSPAAAGTALIAGYVTAAIIGLLRLARGGSLRQSIAMGPWLQIGAAAALPGLLG